MRVDRVAEAHHHHHGHAVRRQALEHRTIRVFGVTGDDHETGRHAAVRHRDAGERRRRDRRASRPARPRTERPAAASASPSSPPRPKTNGSPPLRRTTFLPARAARIISQWMNSCVTAAGPRACRRRRAAPRRQRERRGVDERVVQHEVRVGRAAPAAFRVSSVGIAGTGADERHEASFRLRSGHRSCSRAEACLRSVLSVLSAASIRGSVVRADPCCPWPASDRTNR